MVFRSSIEICSQLGGELVQVIVKGFDKSVETGLRSVDFRISE